MFAIVRDVSPAIERCELTHLERATIDLDVARAQHDRYVQALAALGCSIARLPEDANQPDSVFVEDTAVVLDEVAVITRPGAVSRREETAAVEQVLRRYREIRRIEAPGTLDGGDVLRVGRTFFVGMSGRSNRDGLEQLQEIVAPIGYSVVPVIVRGCLHLKSAVTEVAPETLLVNPAWLPEDSFREFERVEIDPSEPFAANALRIGNTVVHAAAFPRTRDRLAARGIDICPVDMSELAKAEGAVTCCSLIVR